MPPFNILARARRLFQPTPQQQPPPAPPDSPLSQYDTDGSSYELLVVETPAQNPHPQQHPQPQQPPAEADHAPATPPQQSKLPAALRRIDAGAADLPQTPGYDLRPRTRPADAHPPQQQAAPRPRDVRPAPSARTTSGIAGRPSLVARRDIDDASVVTLRAMCRSFGLPTAGTKADLRTRALEKLAERRVLDEQTQQLDSAGNPVELKHADSHDPQSGKEITTSTVKPSAPPPGDGLCNAITAPAHSKSDEPSVHAKSDMPPPKDNPNQVTDKSAAGCTAKSSQQKPTIQIPAATVTNNGAIRPTVSSTGVNPDIPASPLPPPLLSTPRLSDALSRPVQQRRAEEPTESVDARGGVDLESLFQDLASGSRKLSTLEYDAALKALQDNVVERPQPVQVPINAARVSLNTLPTVPTLNVNASGTAHAQPVLIPMGSRQPTQSPLVALPNTPGVTSSSAFPEFRTPGRGVEDRRAGTTEQDGNEFRRPSDVVRADRMHAGNPGLGQLSSRRPGTQGKNVDSTGGASRRDCVPLGGGRRERDTDLTSEHRHGDGARSGTGNALEAEQRKAPGKESTPQTVGAAGSRVGDDIQNINNIGVGEYRAIGSSPLPAVFAGAVGGPDVHNILRMDEERFDAEVNPQVKTNGDEGLQAGNGDNVGRERTGQHTEQEMQCENEVRRSEFATPRDIFRRFNGHSGNNTVGNDGGNDLMYSDNEDAPTATPNGINPGRSSSGVPLLRSSRRMASLGTSIAKRRTSARARESQEHVKRMDRIHNLSGRPSFRAQRPLSSSSRSLLVDLRRSIGSTGLASESKEKRGSYQAEVARRPPPMSASALKILGELQKIRNENRSAGGSKRNSSPLPIPPSVVKRARRSGSFTPLQSTTSDAAVGAGDLGDDMRDVGSARRLAESRTGEPITPVLGGRTFDSSAAKKGRRLPVVAYGSGKRRSKRAKPGLSKTALSAIQRHVETEPGLRAENATAEEQIPKKTKFTITRVLPNDDGAESQWNAPGTDDTGTVKTKAQSASEEPDDAMRTSSAQPDALHEKGFKPQIFGSEASPLAFGSKKEARKKFQALPEEENQTKEPVSASEKQSEDISFKVSAAGGVAPPEPSFKFASNAAIPDEINPFRPQTASGQEKTDATLPGVSKVPHTFGTASERVEKGSTEAAAKTGVTDSGTLGAPLSSSNEPVNKAAEANDAKEDPSATMPATSGLPVLSTSEAGGFKPFSLPSESGIPGIPFSGGPSASSPFPTTSLFGSTSAGQAVVPDSSAEKEKPGNNANPIRSTADKVASAPLSSVTPLPAFGIGTSLTANASKPVPTKGQESDAPPFGTNTLGFASTVEPHTQGPLQSSNAKPKESATASETPLKDSQFVPNFRNADKEQPVEPAPQKDVTSEALVTEKREEAKKQETDGNPFGLKPSPFAPSSGSGFSSPAKAIFSAATKEVSAAKAPESFPTNAGAFGVEKSSEPPTDASNAMGTSATPTGAFKFGERPNPFQAPAPDGNALSAKSTTSTPFGTGQLFGKGPSPEQSQSGFSFTTPVRDVGNLPTGPFADAKFNASVSSAAAGGMFVFGGNPSTEATATAAPSAGMSAQSGPPNNPFASGFAGGANVFGSQTTAADKVSGQKAEPDSTFSAGSGPADTFNASGQGTGSTFGQPFSSNQNSLFNQGSGPSTGNALAPPVQPPFGFGGSSSAAPLFGNGSAPSKPFGMSSAPASAPSFAASASQPMTFGAPQGPMSGSAFGTGHAPGTSFGSSGGFAFGGSGSTPSQNPFAAPASMTAPSAGNMFGGNQSGAFAMGSTGSAKAPQTQRRRTILRGRRTLR